MKCLLVIMITIATLFIECKKSSKTATTYMSTGTIMGQEPFMTPCDAKYWIKIDDTAAGRTFDTLPAGSGINPDFPTFSDSIKVKLNWHNTGSCAIVVIDAVERVD
jgi:hypothetical protein